MRILLTILLILSATSCGKKANDAKVSTKNTIKVSFLSDAKNPVDESIPVQPDAQSYTPGEILIHTQWGQRTPYNDMLPQINGAKPVLGCLPVALAQMTYYHRPQFINQMRMQHNLIAQNGELRYGNYLWDEIQKYEVENQSSKIGKYEIQKLNKNIGQIMGTNYSSTASSTSTGRINSFLKAFGFINNYQQTEFRGRTDSDENYKFPLDPLMESIIVEEIDNFRPILVSIDGRKIPLAHGEVLNRMSTINYSQEGSTEFVHAIIIDGYRYDSNNQLEVHINWGWNGRSNGFYKLDGGLKLLITQSPTDRSFAYFPKITLYHKIKKCENQQHCPVPEDHILRTTYNSRSGLVKSSSSANHTKTPIATLELTTTPLLIHRSGYFNLHLKEKATGSQYTYTFMQRNHEVRTRLTYDQTPLPPGQYEVSFSSLNIANRDLNAIPIEFHILNSESQDAFDKIIIPVDEPSSLRSSIDLDTSTPHSITENNEQVIFIPIIAPTQNTKYRLNLINPSENISIINDYLILKNLSTLPEIISVEIGLSSINANNEEVEIDHKNLTFIKSDKILKAAAPNVTFSGTLQNESAHEFYLYAQGNCQISGSRGYGNQAFYYSIISLENQTFDKLSNSIRVVGQTQYIGNDREQGFELPAGLYKIIASNSFRYSSFNISEKPDFIIEVNCDQSSHLAIDQINSFYGIEAPAL